MIQRDQFIKRSRINAVQIATDPRLSMNTAPAAQSFARAMSGCCSGCTRSRIVSMAVLMSSVARRHAMVRRASAHQIGFGLKAARVSTASAAKNICVRKLASVLKADRTPLRA